MGSSDGLDAWIEEDEWTRVGNYRLPPPQILVTAIVFLVSVFLTGPIAAAVVSLVAYGLYDEYAGGTSGEETSSETEKKTKSATFDGPTAEVITHVPEGMGAFDADYTVYVTSKHPVTVELERSTDRPVGRLLRKLASYLGYADSPAVRRLYAEPPRAVREEAVWRVRNDLDNRLDDERTPEGRFACGTCTIEAADGFDGFRYTVEYPSDYVRSD